MKLFFGLVVVIGLVVSIATAPGRTAELIQTPVAVTTSTQKRPALEASISTEASRIAESETSPSSAPVTRPPKVTVESEFRELFADASEADRKAALAVFDQLFE